MTDDQLDAIADAFGSLLDLLHRADPRDKAELYARVGLRMIYRPGPDTVIAEVAPRRSTVSLMGVRGGT